MQNKKYIIVVLITIGVILLWGFINKNKKQLKEIDLKLPSPTISHLGKFYLTAGDTSHSFKVNQDIKVVVNADSKQRPITGYDIVIDYRQSMVDVIDSRSLLPNFQFFNLSSQGKIRLTGVKDIIARDPVIFTNTPLAEIVIRPKKTGELKLNLVHYIGSTTDSNLVQDKKGATADILTDTQGVKLQIVD